ncbi:MAG TPA: penicillin-binding transpeptidase domain-containing protein, partial [Acidimicrobiales bacterium]|nr:penicillin-binding transpeptidase domain-containing protein [Acidimicrobiales bacterium]
GAVVALASNPTYSLTEWVGGISTATYDSLTKSCTTTTAACPLNDYAIQGLYTPGSTFKLATATAALQTGLITPNTTIKDTGTFTIKTTTCKTGGPGCSFKDDTPGEAGTVTVTSALAKSDDYFFYTMGYRFYKTAGHYGPTPIQDTANAYGFGKLTTVDLPDEAQGRVDSAAEVKKLHDETPKNFPNTTWYVGNNIEMAFGQGGTVVTPIEEAQAYATFANGGTRYQPQVASAVVTPTTGKIVKRFSPKAMGKVTLSASDRAAMAKGFTEVVNTPHGTAYQTFQQVSKVPKTYPISGKTGTADVSKTTAKEPNAWFVGFGPTNTTHQYVVAVVVNQGGYGATAAAPAVANIFNYLYSNPVSSTPKVPTAAEQPSTTPPTTIPPIGTPAPTTTTTAPGSPASPTTTTTAATTRTTAPKTGGGG